MELWNNRAAFTRIVDGDTFVMLSDRGQHQYSLEMYRLEDIDTWETRRPTMTQGRAAREAALQWLREKTQQYQTMDGAESTLLVDGVRVYWPFDTHTELDDSFGRYLVVVQARVDGESLSAFLRANGHEKVTLAVPELRQRQNHLPPWTYQADDPNKEAWD